MWVVYIQSIRRREEICECQNALHKGYSYDKYFNSSLVVFVAYMYIYSHQSIHHHFSELVSRDRYHILFLLLLSPKKKKHLIIILVQIRNKQFSNLWDNMIHLHYTRRRVTSWCICLIDLIFYECSGILLGHRVTKILLQWIMIVLKAGKETSMWRNQMTFTFLELVIIDIWYLFRKLCVWEMTQIRCLFVSAT